MQELLFIFSVACAALLGCVAGFAAGLVPGLHVNNIAALMTAYAGASVAAFCALASVFGGTSGALLASCFVCSALIGHLFSEGIVAAYVGVPAGDTVSVLPAHRLARAGLGRLAVTANADGTLAGVVIGTAALGPICLILGPPLGLYGALRPAMGVLVVVFSAWLVASERRPCPGERRMAWRSLRPVLSAACVFLLSGSLGMIVLQSDYGCCPMPSLPWEHDPWTRKSALLLPMFAGLFGVPNLLLSIGCRPPMDLRGTGAKTAVGGTWTARAAATAVAGGVMVGWVPGMTSGSTASLLCRDHGSAGDSVDSARSFIWSYSAISAAGAVLSVGALFIILRARSGVMDAAMLFLGQSVSEHGLVGRVLPMLCLLFSMVLSAYVARGLTPVVDSRLSRTRQVLSSEKASLAVLAFLVSLVVGLTGFRGLMVLVCAVLLGLLPPRLGLRKIDLMGSLLVPIAYTFLC